ncbi:imidazolonepropionase [Risungbinella massiliensis]|uniref:imidazolonepropionase n=1 Tax=Risungbinella massiliensis TaxID=1329796 RepID=UPI0005CBAB7C|nr:imidazolonepropionase [Risungbinella massiliensis]
MKQIDLFVHNIGSLITMRGSLKPKVGKEMSEIEMIAGGAIAVHQGRIAAIGPEEEVRAQIKGIPVLHELNAKGRLVTPGLIDPHTHLVHGGSREHELEWKRQGVPYLEILAKGGGIHYTVEQTRLASEEALYQKAKNSLDWMLKHGTTTIEAKSGYGLDTQTELKQLRVAKQLDQTHPVDIVSTFLGAHAVPKEYVMNRKGYVDLVIREMLPEVKRLGLANYCDVFCEEGVFSVEESRQILQQAMELGFGIKIHADEVEPLGGAELAGELGCISAEHLLASTENGLRKMRESGTIAVCLPATSFSLGLKRHAQARMMIDLGVPVALATDYNPGSSPTESLQIVMTLASVNLSMSPEEVLTAMTINAAHAIGRADSIGSLEIGKWADFVLYQATNLAYLPYHFGINHVDTVVKKGKIVVENGQIWEKYH